MGKKLEKLLKTRINQVAQLFSLQATEEEEVPAQEWQLAVTVSSPSQSLW